MPAVGRPVTVLLVFALILTALKELTWNLEENKCEMTYMREMPEYIPIKLSGPVRKQYPRYALYLYGEGYYATAHRSSLSSLSGTPVLFIPGNGGSYQQARSLGSVSLVASEQKNHRFDYFTIDFSEELVALYGANLRKQTAFVATCVKHILHLYEHHSHGSRPSTVVLVGHSMGGLVARAVFMLPSFDKSSVQLILTQATPHQRPVVSVDAHLDDFYDTVNRYWRDHKDTALAHVVVVSTGGGVRDIQVPYYLTVLDKLTSPSNGISVSTTAVPAAWVSTDHLCAVWCLQTVVTTVQALYSVIDPNTKQLLNAEVVAESFRRRFTGERSPIIEKIRFDATNLTEIVTSSSLQLSKYKSSQPKYYFFSIPPGADTFYAEASKPMKAQWVLGCRLLSDRQNCTDGADLSRLAVPLPPAPKLRLRPEYFLKDYREVLDLPEKPRHGVLLASGQLAPYTHVALLLPGTPGKSSFSVSAEVFAAPTRSVVYRVPGPLDLVLDLPRSLIVHVDEVIAQTEAGALFYNVSLAGLDSMFQAYTARLSILRCTGPVKSGDSGSSHAASSVMRLHLPWSKGSDVYSASRSSSESLSMPLKLQAPLPPSDHLRQSAELHLHLQPDCIYSLHIEIAFAQVVAQFFRHYFILVPAYVVSSLIAAQLGLGSLRSPTGDSTVRAYWHVVSWPQTAVVAVLPPMLVHVVSRLYPASSQLKADTQLLHAVGLDFVLLPLCLHVVAFAAATVHVFLLGCVIKALSALVRALFCRVQLCRPRWLSLLASCAVLATAAYLAQQQCAAIGLLLVHGLHIAQVACRGGSEDQMIDSSKTKNEDGRAQQHSRGYAVRASLVVALALDQWFLLLTSPSLLHWAKYSSVSWRLDDDPWTYQVLARILLATVAYVCQFFVSESHQNNCEKISVERDALPGRAITLIADRLAAAAAVLYCGLRMYRLTWVIVISSALSSLKILLRILQSPHATLSPSTGKTKAE